jgi:hypothetical protein
VVLKKYVLLLNKILKKGKMRAIEFTSTIQENQIMIPTMVQPELTAEKDKSVRVIVFMADIQDNEASYRQMTKKQFLKGYADSDAIYDL